MVPSATSFDSLMSYLSQQEGQLPPVEAWDPAYCGEMDLVIKANGEWWHEKTPIGRKKLYKLFSTIIKKTGDEYFLVTPVEKIKIQVDWQPFVIVDFQLVEIEGVSCYEFIDNCDNKRLLTQLDQLSFSQFQQQALPIVNIRRNLYASFSRSCYYRLIEQADLVECKGGIVLQIKSNGLTFDLGKVRES
ncbi:MAG: DUF1285 domain-containing protein [Kangiellaceae bacterium]|jgi:uncharacterized protein